ncbi:unnamed protein product [Peniophora sp. CBMAI 1063]|nr:unnamed protein product [Peniophora sp. CBMAI 1063]
MVSSQHETQPLLDKKIDEHDGDVKDALPPPRYSFSSNDNTVAEPASAVNGLSITGSYQLDPSLPLEKTDRRGGWHRHETPPTANLQARHGNITTKIAVTGDAPCANHATIRATSRTGDITLDITEKSAARNVDIETWTRRGTTIVLLPPTFAGVIELNTCRGRLIQLPGLEEKTALLRSTEQTLSFVVGTVCGDGKDAKADFVRLSSKKGGIAVGFSGVDGEAQALENVRKELSACRRRCGSC